MICDVSLHQAGVSTSFIVFLVIGRVSMKERLFSRRQNVPTQIDVFFFLSIVLKKLNFEHWKFTYPPTLLHWKKEMGYYLNMERSVATEKSF